MPSVPTCKEMHPVHTIALDLEDPLVFHTHLIGRHKIFACLMPYLLLVNVGEFLANGFLSFFLESCIGMIPGFVKRSWFFRYRHGFDDEHYQINEKI